MGIFWYWKNSGGSKKGGGPRLLSGKGKATFWGGPTPVFWKGFWTMPRIGVSKFFGYKFFFYFFVVFVRL